MVGVIFWNGQTFNDIKFLFSLLHRRLVFTLPPLSPFSLTRPSPFLLSYPSCLPPSPLFPPFLLSPFLLPHILGSGLWKDRLILEISFFFLEHALQRTDIWGVSKTLFFLLYWRREKIKYFKDTLQYSYVSRVNKHTMAVRYWVSRMINYIYINYSEKSICKVLDYRHI